MGNNGAINASADLPRPSGGGGFRVRERLRRARGDVAVPVPNPRSRQCGQARRYTLLVKSRTFPKVAECYFSASLFNTLQKSLRRSNSARWRKGNENFLVWLRSSWLTKVWKIFPVLDVMLHFKKWLLSRWLLGENLIKKMSTACKNEWV